MKKLYFLLISLFTFTISFSQATDLYFSMYGEGSSNNKFLEIYNGTGASIDLSSYSVKLFANGATTATNTQTFTSGTILANGDVYVLYNSSANQSIKNNGDIASSTTNFNGDDAVVLLKNDVNIDIIGVVGVDPGTAWNVAGVTNATADHTLTRKSTICSPTTDWSISSGTDADSSQWLVTASDSGWDTIGSFSGCSSTPNLTINFPSNNQIFNPETTSVDVTFSVQNFTVANGTGDGHIQYTVDGGSVQSKYDTDAISLTGLASGSHTVYMELVDNSAQVLSPEVNASVTFEIATYTTVNNLAALRASTLNGYYQVTGEVIATYAQTFNNQKWGQDDTAGIMIHDPNGVVTTVYNLGDGISGAKGQLIAYAQLLQFVPTVDFGAPTSTGHTVTPVVVTLADLNANVTAYESELVKVMQVTVSDLASGGDGTFLTGKSYPITDASGSGVLRTQFYDADYIGQTLPATPVDAVCIVGNYNGAAQVTPRNLADITLKAGGIVNIDGFSMYPNPAKNQLNIRTADNLTKNVQIFNVLGKQVLAKTMSGNTLDINLPTGIYVVKVEEAGKIATQKLMIQ